MEQPALPSLPSRRTILWIAALFFAATSLAYLWPLTHSIFVAWDDTYLIYFNPIVKSFSWKTLHAAFTSYDPELYIPVTFLSYQLDYFIGGLSPVIFHLDNLALHTVNAMLVGWLLHLLLSRGGVMVSGDEPRTPATGNGWIAILGGLLFALHPLHTEAVAWASARKDVLSTLFFLLSLIAYIHYRHNNRTQSYFLSLAAFALGLLAKVMVLTLPVILLLLDLRDRRKLSWKMFLEKIPYVALSIILGIVALFGKRDIVEASSLIDKILMACKSTVFYLEKLFVPVHLSVLYPYSGPISIGSPDFFVPVIVVIILTALVLWSLRYTRDIAFGFFFFLITVMPTFVNFTKGGDLYFASDRYAYLPSIGILFIVVLATGWFVRSGDGARSEDRRKRLAGVVSGLVLATFLVLTFQQALTWRDSVALFTNTLRNYPRVMAAHLNLAMVYREMGETEKSMEQLRLADTLRPHSRTHVAFATLYEREGNTTKAIEEYRKAMSIDPKDPEPYFGLGILEEKMGRLTEARALYEKVLQIDPQYIGTYNNLGALALKEGNREEARRNYEKAIEIDPYFPDAHYNLGLMLEQDGEADAAIAEYEISYDLQPKKALDALDHLLDLYAKKNDLTKTVDTANRILTLDPDNERAGALLAAFRQRGMIP
ncbi:tetratricopeptide repeat protein [Candidatus Peregrinibacteria bacterium]|nr:tetratricopeptide repeat protein [Candidatus Peregrinibacteria bacterium]